MESEKKAGDKKPNARGTIASTSQGDIERSTREMLGDPHCEQCSVEGFCFIFLSHLSSGCVLVAELGASLPARNAPELGLLILPIVSTKSEMVQSLYTST